MIKPSEARDIFEKWKSENTSLMCWGDLHSCWTFFVRGRVTALTDSMVDVRTADGLAGVRLELSQVEDFEYAEAKDAPLEIRERMSEGFLKTAILLVALPLRVSVPTMPRDKLFFVEDADR